MEEIIKKFDEAVAEWWENCDREAGNGFPLNGLCDRIAAVTGIPGYWVAEETPHIGGARYHELPDGEKWGDTIALMAAPDGGGDWTLSAWVRRGGEIKKVI